MNKNLTYALLFYTSLAVETFSMQQAFSSTTEKLTSENPLTKGNELKYSSLFPDKFSKDLKHMILSMLEINDLENLRKSSKGNSALVDLYIKHCFQNQNRPFAFFEKKPTTYMLKRAYKLLPQQTPQIVNNYLKTWPNEPTFSQKILLIEDKIYELPEKKINKIFMQKSLEALDELCLSEEINIEEVIKYTSNIPESLLNTIRQKNSVIDFCHRLKCESISDLYTEYPSLHLMLFEAYLTLIPSDDYENQSECYKEAIKIAKNIISIKAYDENLDYKKVIARIEYYKTELSQLKIKKGSTLAI